MNPIVKLACAVLAAALASGAQGEVCRGQSPAQRLALVELYTSEGCSSCPPADDWLRTLKQSSAGRVTPIALHVDYWDSLGWKDRFASATFSARQREQASTDRRSFVYTPQVVVAGRDFGRWRSRDDFARAVARINASPARAQLSLELEPDAGGRVEAHARAVVPAPADRGDAALYLAVLENGLSSRVAAGENRGATLHHDFVARAWAGPVAIDAGGAAQASAAAAALASPAAMGALAFVQNRRTGEGLQSFELPLCSGAAR